jgi:hypothetical protein
MLRLRFWLMVLIAYLFLLFNIERINESINIASFVYVLVTFAAGLTLLLWRFSTRIPILGLIAPYYVIFFVLKVLLDYQIGGENLPITVLEMLSILITILIVRQISLGMWDFEETMLDLTIRQIGLPPRMYETTETEELYREIKRSRRFQNPLTLLVMKPRLDPSSIELSRTLIELQKTMATRYLQARLAKMLSETLRDYDLVATMNDDFVILLPEATTKDAEIVIDKICRDAQEQLNVEISFGATQFPEGGVTLMGLIATAEDNLKANCEE